MKKLALYLIIPLIIIFAWAGKGESKTDSYYSGDAISFNGQVYVATADTNSLELFRLDGNQLTRLTSLKPFDSQYGVYGSFYDVKLAVENNTLMAYAIGDFSLYKYSLTPDNNLSLVDVQKNTYWEWYSRVNKFGDNIVTISNKGITVWNTNLQSFNSYDFTNTDTFYNIRGFNNQYILNIQNNTLSVYDRVSREVVGSAPLSYETNIGNRAAYQDNNNQVYVVDDNYAKKFDLNGNLIASFKHLDYQGYDINASGATNFVYFTNGIGVVKLNKDTMKLTASRWTNYLGGPQGWAMGLKVVYNNGDKVVVFNNSNILVLDDNLKKIASYQATAQAPATVTENLYLNLDHNLGSAGSVVTLSGGGYFPKEVLNITFGSNKSQVTTDSQGRFSEELSVPQVLPGQTDIKVVGQSSLLSYSISFKVIP